MPPDTTHHDNYMRLFWEHHKAEMEQLISIRERLDKVEMKLGQPRLRGLFGTFGMASESRKAIIVRSALTSLC